ncbi:O-acetylhomoserine aminocarboxypropyltransferase/cysteine synthase [Puniceicoccales bacterium CK1056]|uniref:O-acetylhomoserine aminocarboxypropyltransferase/cysteine synthase n=1 Tax=Oceanipulchritudo coccoides TaxID=2706888 RepID=A0A6B2M5L4_9BACT|nr:PLP-dependent transferase [Oceanipulchritudo coccoides]NDV63404.1 O-acetylhomoserine aminocarboxypropyltransferase/cysteine synthase [Oceanipulchritudo coccoides]
MKSAEYWIARGKEMSAKREERLKNAMSWKFDTVATHGLYDLEQALGSHSGSIMEPVYLSPAQAYADSGHMEAALSYQMPTWCYSRIANPSSFFLEETIALLEGYGTDHVCSGLATSSGMSAIRTATDPFLVRDDSLPPANIVTSAQVYGGTFQQFRVRRFEEQGIEVRWVRNPAIFEEWAELIDEGTRFVYGEFPSNPSLSIFDIRMVASLAHDKGIPLIVDSTCASPALTRPIAHGADIVIHSASKVIGASGYAIAGLIVSKMNIPSKVGPDEMRADFATWAKLWPFRDNGPNISPMTAILILNDLRSLRMRMAQMSSTADTVARWLEEHDLVDRVNYPGLKSFPNHELARETMQLVDSGEPTFGFMLSFEVKETVPGDTANTRKFYDGLNMIWRATDLGRVKTVATWNAISTHQQQGEEGRSLASIKPNTIRLSVGIEHPDDIIADLAHAFSAVAPKASLSFV